MDSLMADSEKNTTYEDIRVLILEDKFTDAELLEHELREAGFPFISKRVETKQSYIKALQNFRPDIILSDYDLPSFSGSEALKIKKELCPETPFILVTGAVGEDRAIEILTGGATDYVLKKNLSRLIPAVNRALHESYERRKRKEAETERDRLLKELEFRAQTSEERYRALFNNVSELITFDELLYDDQGNPVDWRVLDVNPAFLKRWGKSRDEIIGQHIFGGKVTEPFLKHFSLVVKTGQPVQFEIFFEPLQLYLLISAFHIRGPYFSRIAVDITDRKKLENELRDKEEGYLLALESGNLGTFRRNFKENRAILDERCQKFLNLPAETTFDEWISRVHPDDAVVLKKKIEESSSPQGNGRVEAEYRMIHSDGSVHWIAANSQIHFSGVGNSRNPIYVSGIVQDISDRKQAEEEFRASKERMLFALETSHIGAWDLNLEDLSVSAVRTLEHDRIFGYSELIPEWTYEKFLEHVLPEDREAVDRKFRKSLETESDWNFECRIRRIDNEVRWIWAAGRHRHLNGAPKIMSGIVQDITERKLTEEKSERQKSILSGIATIFHKALTCKTEEELGLFCLQVLEEVTRSKFGLIGEINPETGRLDDIAISNPGWDLCRMEDQEGHGRKTTGSAIHGLYGRVILDGKGFFTNDPYSHPDSIGTPEGHPPLTSFLGAPLSHAGKTIGVVALGNREAGYGPEELEVVESIAPAIVQAFISKRAEEEARESAHLLKTVMDSSPDPIFIKDREGRFLFGNPALLRIWGKSLNEVIGKKDSDLYSDRAIADAVMENDRLVMESGESKAVEEIVQTQEGLRTYLSMKSPRFDSRGNVDGIIGIARDITERKVAEKERERLISDLESANRELESFTYSVSHDLRAPLRAIDGFSSMLMKTMDLKLDQEEKRRLALIQENTTKMNRLIDDLLALSRVGRAEIMHKRINMTRIAESTWEQQLTLNPDLKIDFVAYSLPDAFGDEGLILQVFSNLLSNAVKFTRKRRKPVIEIGGKTSRSETVYYIKDNGAGFNMKYYDKLFGVFQRLHSEREYEGTGVGLAIVQRIIHRHGGRVWAEGKVGKGATFYFSLPRR
jgi:PAS domain S-box-containing protein